MLAFLAAAGQSPGTVAELLEAVGVGTGLIADLPWYEGLLERKLPCHGWRGEIEAQGQRLARCLEAGTADRPD